MNGAEFVRRGRRYAKKAGLECRFEPGHGKGSHGRLWIGGRFTTVQRGELKKGVLSAMLRQLGVSKEDF